MNDDVVIRVEGLWKRYGLPLPNLYYKGRRWLRSLRGRHLSRSEDGLWALRDIDLEVRRGETLGIVGPNGAGKSTLLKILSGVTPATQGQVKVRGRVFPMIELNAGLHMELSGRENVFLLGAIMGLTRLDVKAILPDIEAFCELGAFFDEPVRKYSSGMLVRLGFAVAIHVQADVLLIDEVMAVGDMAFQRKCYRRMEELHDSGATILLVSHGLRVVERLCHRVLLLDRGRPVALGDPRDVLELYYRTANENILAERVKGIEGHGAYRTRPTNAVVEIDAVRLVNGDGKESSAFRTGEPMTIRVDYTAHERIVEPIIGIGIATVDSLYVSGFTNELENGGTCLQGKGTFECYIPRLPLLNGVYGVWLKIKDQNGGTLGGGQNWAFFQVIVPGKIRRAVDHGFTLIEARWHV